jgi:gamma-glutamyltranspeptidase
VDSVARRHAAAASEPHVAQAAREALSRGNAVDAVIAGALMAAAESPSVLLGPFQFLAGGAGAGLIAIDGRVRQPGVGAPRPRGFLADEPVPDAAHVGVPAMPSAMITALATLGAGSLLKVGGPALAWARSRSPERAFVLEAIARKGAPALAEDSIAGELTAVAGRVARGLLTTEDLAAARPFLSRCEERSLEPSGILEVPWTNEGATGASYTHVVAAADSRGMVAIACYEAPVDGVAVPALGLVAPRAAAPVLRGKPRVTPGEPRPSAAPIAIRARRGLVDLALGHAAAEDASASLEAVLQILDESPTVGEALKAARGGRPVAIVWTRESARAFGSS